MPRVEPNSMNTLGAKDHFNLTTLVNDEYVTKGLSDVDFAIYAGQKLGITITNNNVSGARRALEIPSTKTASSISNNTTIIQRLVQLESTVKELQAHILRVERRV
jgi:hypothetical protein